MELVKKAQDETLLPRQAAMEEYARILAAKKEGPPGLKDLDPVRNLRHVLGKTLEDVERDVRLIRRTGLLAREIEPGRTSAGRAKRARAELKRLFDANPELVYAALYEAMAESMPAMAAAPAGIAKATTSREVSDYVE